mgnify:FL=1|jgi:excisionase family DNA binding protein
MNKLSKKDAYRLMLREYPDVMTIEQMCEALGVSKKTGYKMLQSKTIASVKVGRAYRIPKIYILNYLQVVNEGE